MPRPRKTYKKKTKARKYVKRYAKASKYAMKALNTEGSMLVPKPPLFPVKKWARLNYYETAGTITGVAGIVGGYAYSANGLYDPNITGIGHQPIGFDQMMALYNHYTVLYSKCTVTFSNITPKTIMCGIFISADGVVITDPNQLNENGMLVKTQLNPQGQDGACKTICISANIGRINGIKNPLNEFNMRGDALNNPNEQTYFVPCTWANFTTGDAVVNYSVLLEYGAWFTEPRKLTLS